MLLQERRVSMEPNDKLEKLLEELQDELIQMQITDNYYETDEMKWLFKRIKKQLVIMGITKE